MIKIIKGSYGMVVGKSVTRIDAGADPIELSAEQEARLVRIGVAEYVNDAAAGEIPPEDPADQSDSFTGEDEDPADEQDKDQGDDEDESSDVGELPAYSESMKLDELRKIAEAYGVDASSIKSKKAVIAAIEEAKVAPALGAVDPVE